MTIVEQLQAYCECTEVSEKNVDELVTLVSMATCWTGDVKNAEFLSGDGEPMCDTFLKGRRREVIDLPSCADCPFEFSPYYFPFDTDSFNFYLVKQEGIEEIITEITDYAYHYSDDMFHLNLGLPSCKCACDPCGCPPKYKMIVEYDAGFDNLPDCLLPVFCDMLEMIRAKNDCDCRDCGCDNGSNNEEYAEGDVITEALRTELGAVLLEQYKGMIGAISLCNDDDGLWGAVV